MLEVLVGCHTRKIKQDGKITGHFYADCGVFDMTLPVEAKCNFTCVDIQPNGTHNSKENYISADIFGADFIGQHEQNYDRVYIPDCSWVLGFTETDLKVDGNNKIKNRVASLLALLRTEQSVLYIGKLCIFDSFNEEHIIKILREVYPNMTVIYTRATSAIVCIKRPIII